METRKALLTDFDGTLTNIAGGALVFTQHYRDVTSTADRNASLEKNTAEADTIRGKIHALEAEKTSLKKMLTKSKQAERHADPLTTSYGGEGVTSQEFKNRANKQEEIAAEIEKLRPQLSEINTKLMGLYDKLNTYVTSIYHLMIGEQLDPEQVKARSLEIYEKMQNQPHDDFIMAKDAKEFLMKLLEENIPIHIISKNHEEYIRAVLMHNGFSEENLQKIEICDVRHGGGNKYAAAIRVMEKYGPNTIVTICDDDHKDYTRLKDAVDTREIKELFPYHASAGNFDFKTIGESLLKSPEQKTALQQHSLLTRAGSRPTLSISTDASHTQSAKSSPLSPKK